jgi:hypothetical protein
VGVRANKAEVREFLEQRDFVRMAAWADSVRSPHRVLFSLALDEDHLISWRAIEFIGRLAGREAEGQLENMRDMIRRLLWLMNDESGGLGWHSPEMIGEILMNVPSLIDEYGRLLLAYLREEPFENGVHEAIARISELRPDLYIDSAEELVKSLEATQASTRYYAAAALWSIDPESQQKNLARMLGDPGNVEIYDFHSGQLINSTVGESLKKYVTGSTN